MLNFKSNFQVHTFHLLSPFHRDFSTSSKFSFPHSEDVSKFSDNTSSICRRELRNEMESKRKTYLSLSDEDSARNKPEFVWKFRDELNKCSKEEAEEKVEEEKAKIGSTCATYLEEIKDDVAKDKDRIALSSCTEESKKQQLHEADNYLQDIIRETDEHTARQLQRVDEAWDRSNHSIDEMSPVSPYSSEPESEKPDSEKPDSESKVNKVSSNTDKGSLLDEYANPNDQPMDYFGCDD